MTPGISLVLAAGGSGTRLGGGEPKQFRDLAGVPVILRSLRAFIGLVSEVVAVVPENRLSMADALLRPTCVAAGIPLRIVVGGATRLHSVLTGVEATDANAAKILVHDAARPLVAPAAIAAVIAALDHAPGAVLATACRDTVKESAGGDAGATVRVSATLDRRRLWLAQTPQGFHRTIGLTALRAAVAAAVPCDDDVQAIERQGHAVTIVPGGPWNLKLTVAEDWPLAEALLARG